MIAVSKPAGQLTIPGRGEPGEPLNLSLGRKVYVVHRLDREASGLVIFAKDPGTHKDLCRRFEERTILKTYLALADGLIDSDGKIDAPLREFGSGRTAVDPKGKPSLTRYRVKDRLRGATLLEIDLVTGRRHQIRAHLYSIGHPVCGDTLYGKERPVAGAPRLMLHSLEAAFEDFKLRAEPPEDFKKVLAVCR